MKLIYRYLLTGTLSIGTSFLIHDALGFSIPFFLLLLTETIVMAFIYLFYRYRTSMTFYLIFEVFLLLCLLVGHLGNISYLSFFDTFTRWCLKGFPVEDVTFAYPMTAIFILLFALSIVAFLLHTYFYARAVIAIMVSSLLLFLAFREYPVSFSPVFYLLFYCFIVFYEWYYHIFYVPHSHTQTGGESSPSAVTGFLVPIMLLTVLTTCVIPHSKEPIRWTFVKNAYYGVRDFMESIPGKLGELLGTTSSEFALSMTGYSESAGLRKGGIADSETVSLSLFAPSVPKGSLYLNGSILDAYTGSSWERHSKRNDAVSDYLLDAYELLFALAQFETPDNPESWDLMEIKELTLTYEDVSTKTVFYPSKTITLNIPDSFPYTIQGDNLLFDKVKKKGTNYRFTYCNPNYYNERFVRILQAWSQDVPTPPYPSDTDRAKAFLATHFQDLTKQLPEKGLEDMLIERRKRIRQDYLQLPDSLPERVTALAKDLTKDCENDYDRLKAIEAYLNTMEYTKSPPIPPEGRDVVDYFLFDGKKGYCTYFASSMAVMARCIGLPSRYVQGFTTSFKNHYSTYTYHVVSNRAHAWTEVYLEGVGWIPFEPTSGYEGVRYKEWEPDAAPSPKKKAELSVQPPPAYEEEVITDEDSYVAIRKRGKYLPFIMIPILLLLCIAGFFFLYLGVKILQTKKQYEKMKEDERFLWEFHHILSLLAMQGYRLFDGETLTQYTERIAKPHPDLRPLSESYIPIRYGKGTIGGKELSLAKDFRVSLEKELKESIGRLRFHIYLFRVLTKPVWTGRWEV